MSYCSPVSTVAIVLDPSLLFTRPNTKRYAYPLFVTDNLNCQLIVVTVSCISDCNTVQIAFETSALQFRKVDRRAGGTPRDKRKRRVAKP